MDVGLVQEVQQRVEEWRATRPGAGVAVAVVGGGDIVYQGGFGVRDGALVTPDTPFEAGSLTKPVFASAVLQLVEEGALDLDAALASYLPYPYVNDEANLPLITARHVLSHSAGWPNWRDQAGLRSLFTPGSRFHYSGEGYLYLQTVVEHLTGMSLPNMVAARVFEPLGMRGSVMMLEDWRDYRRWVPPGVRSYAAASLKTTAADYARFLLAMLNPADDPAAPVSPATRRQMLTPQVQVGAQQGLAWGLGWGVQTDTAGATTFWHWGGWRDVTRNFVLGDPARQTGVVILTTSLEGLPLCETVAETALGHTGGYPAFRWLLPVERWRADGEVEPRSKDEG